MTWLIFSGIFGGNFILAPAYEDFKMYYCINEISIVQAQRSFFRQNPLLLCLKTYLKPCKYLFSSCEY